mgnify:CR=1 FL=1
MSNYFDKVPDFNYVSRLPDAKISDYITVKNLFKRGKLADDIFQDLTIFTKYEIEGDDRPDNVAFKLYNNSDLDWVVLLSNNIINIQSEWPLPQRDFDRYLLDKYETYEKLNDVHHYETTEVKNLVGAVVVPEGLWVESDYSVTYYDWYQNDEVTKLSADIVTEVTNYDFEIKKEDAKRNIFLLKKGYLNIIIDDLEEMMEYKKGSTQYVSETLKVAENIRIYQ